MSEQSKEALYKYIEQTSLIRDLSSPSVARIENAEDYRSHLIQNFKRIGELAKENGIILDKHYYPILNSENELSDEDIEAVKGFSEALINAYQLHYLDIPMVYEQSKRLLKEMDHGDDETYRILALDNMVSAAYPMMVMTGRLYPVSDVCLKYQKDGLGAALRLLEYLDYDKFSKLDDASKELILINSRYIRVVSEIDGVPYEEGYNQVNLERMKKALEIERDPFYREQLPDYDWDYHHFRVLEYIVSLTDLHNMREYDEEAVQFINECTKEFKKIYESDPEYFESIHHPKLMELYCTRNAYLAKEKSLEEYRKDLIDIYHAHVVNEFETKSLSILYAPLEYILTLDKEHLDQQDIDFLSEFYNHVVEYMHQTPKKDFLMFLLFFVVMILKNYVVVPGAYNLETMCLSLMAAIHPPTYIHTRSIAKLSTCFVKHLFEKKPELFKGVPCIDETKFKEDQARDLQDYVYHAALMHDVGKLMIAETILTYGRNLLDIEFDLVKAHPEAGAYLLKRYPSLEKYVDIALGHHKWYDNKGGYPASFDLSASPYRTIVEIVACADCLDAATDEVGRSYKKGITLDEFIEELKEGSGTRYAPYLLELFEDPQVVKEVQELLTSGRDDNYRKTFDILKTQRTEW